MDFYDYISSSSPDEALAIFKGYSRIRVTDAEELSDGLRSVMKNLRLEEKKEFLGKLAKIHPDYELMESTIGSPSTDEDIVEEYAGHKCNCSNCQVKSSASGMSAVGHYMSTGEVQTLLDRESNNVSKELDNIKLVNTTKKLMNDRIIQLVLIGIVGFLIFKYAIKNK